jgi:hypothetical protein
MESSGTFSDSRETLDRAIHTEGVTGSIPVASTIYFLINIRNLRSAEKLLSAHGFEPDTT